MVGSRSPSSGSKATHQSTSIYTLREKLQSVLNGTGKHVELCSLRIFKLAKQHLNVLHLIIHIYLVCTIKNDIKECQIENPKEIKLQTVIAHSHSLATYCLWHCTFFANTPDLVDHIQMISPTWHCKNLVLLCSPKDPLCCFPLSLRGCAAPSFRSRRSDDTPYSHGLSADTPDGDASDLERHPRNCIEKCRQLNPHNAWLQWRCVT